MSNIKKKEEWLENRFNQFPKLIDRMKEANGNDKIILRVIFDNIFEENKGVCFPSQLLIARNAGVSRKTVYSSIVKWQSLGFLRCSEKNGRIYYTLKTIPKKFITKYKDDIMIEDIDGLEDVQRIAKEHAKQVFEKRRLKREKKIKDVQDVGSKSLFESSLNKKSITPKQKKLKDSSVKKVIIRYNEVFDKYFNKGMLNHEKRIKINFTGKELGQIKRFCDSYGFEVFLALIDDIFGGWNMYKKQWNIQDTDYPTIGILVTYGKGKIISMSKRLKEQLPSKIEDSPSEEMMKAKKIGW